MLEVTVFLVPKKTHYKHTLTSTTDTLVLENGEDNNSEGDGKGDVDDSSHWH